MIDRIDTHCHTRYSNVRLADALPTPEALIDRAIEIGLKGVAITDHELVGAHIKANMHALEIAKTHPDFKVILGNEIYLVDERPTNKHYHFILLAKDKIGHRQIRILSTLAWLNHYTRMGLERVDTLKSDLERIVKQNPGHLIASSACLGGEISKNILALIKAENASNIEALREARKNIVDFITWCKGLFGEDFYLEIQPGVSREQILVNKRMVSIAECFKVKMIVTSDAHYLKKADRYVHKAFLNAKEGEREVDEFYQDAYLHTTPDMIEKLHQSEFSDIFINKMFKNSMEIYDKIENYSYERPQKIPPVEVDNYPKKENPVVKDYKVLSEMFTSDDKIERYWINTCINRLTELKKDNDKYFSELEEEAEVKRIVGGRLDTNMFMYPITLAHYINAIWDCGSTVGAGRGSACAALNHYLLGITQLDPLEWDFPFFRYMNRDTDSLGDIDIDMCPSKVQTFVNYVKKERGKAFDESIEDIFRENLGATYVCTYGTETSKSAILTACRGYRSEKYPDGIDNDIANYLSSLAPSERGFVWSISEMYFGNYDKDRKAIPQFVAKVDEYPGLLDIMLGIEGCISRRGRHASGVLFMDKDPFDSNAFMVTPSGEVVTQYDLHDAEWAGSTKFDILVTEVQDKITQTIKYLQSYGEIEPDLTLKEAYNKYLHPDALPLEDEKVWKIIQGASSLDLFQLDSEIGRQGAKKVKPDNMIELSSVNGLIRLMTAEKGTETWLDKYVRYKNDMTEYYKDIKKYHLTDEERKTFNKYVGMTNGIGISQEQFMKAVMDPNICGFTLKESNKGRKVISKKKMKEIPLLKELIFEKAVNKNVGNYLWDYIVAPGLGYSFSDIHSISYSFIGFQTAYLTSRWNPIYWNTACLVVNSGSLEDNSTEEIVSIYEPEAEALKEGTTFVDLPDRSGKIKKTSSADYGKIAKAIGAIKSQGVNVSLVNINTSDYSFVPDVENNRILYGLKAISNINEEAIEIIKDGRPYTGIKDFMMRCPLKKVAIINLIKAGAFDEVDKYFKTREEVMVYFLSKNSDFKTKLNLQNFAGLIQHDLIPKEFETQVRVFYFNKYLKSKRKKDIYYIFDENCMTFFEKFFPLEVEELSIVAGVPRIPQKKWDKIYKDSMESVKKYIADNQEEILKQYNNSLFKENWDKYASGNTSKWEMDSVSFYAGPHELSGVDFRKYGIVDFFKLDPKPDIERYFVRGDIKIPIYKIRRIAGTVIAKVDARSSIILLTTTGVVNVKMSRDQYSNFKKQISEIQPDGTKKVLEKSWFGKGCMLIVSGFRREDTFCIKTYARSDTHQIYKIDEVDGDELKMRHERITSLSSIEEEDYDE